MSKSPKSNYSHIKEEKIPHISTEPANYKDHFISWQFGTIDFDSEWGWLDLFEYLTFESSENLNDLLCGRLDFMLDYLSDVNFKKFKNQDDFFEKLYEKHDQSITIHEFRELLKCLKKDFFEKKILSKFKSFESMKWSDLERATHDSGKSASHSINIENLTRKARKRLEELRLNDIDELFSLRLENKFRIFGIRKFGYMQILWFDPNHEICPVEY